MDSVDVDRLVEEIDDFYAFEKLHHMVEDILGPVVKWVREQEEKSEPTSDSVPTDDSTH